LHRAVRFFGPGVVSCPSVMMVSSSHRWVEGAGDEPSVSLVRWR